VKKYTTNNTSLPIPIVVVKNSQSDCYSNIVELSRCLTGNKHSSQDWWKILKQVRQLEQLNHIYSNKLAEFFIAWDSRHWAVKHISSAADVNTLQNTKLLNSIKTLCKLGLRLASQNYKSSTAEVHNTITNIQLCIRKLELNCVTIENLVSVIHRENENELRSSSI